MIVRSGWLSFYPRGWRHDLLRVDSLFTVVPTAVGGYRARLDFRPEKTLDEMMPDERRHVMADYQRLAREVFHDVGRREVLAGLRQVYRGTGDLAGRVEYQLAEAPNDLSMALYIDFPCRKLPREPVLPMLRSVLRYAPATFPRAYVTLDYEPRHQHD